MTNKVLAGKVEHTPTPWKQGYNDKQCLYADYKHVSTMQCNVKSWEANAAFIIKAVNSNEELLAACKELSAWFKDTDYSGAFKVVLDKANHAIAKASGEINV